MADTIEYTQDQVYTDESAQLITTYDECEWKTFQREASPTEPTAPAVIDDEDEG